MDFDCAEGREGDGRAPTGQQAEAGLTSLHVDDAALAKAPKQAETTPTPAAATISRSPAAKAVGSNAAGLAATRAATTTAITEQAETKMPTLAVSPMQTASATATASRERLAKRAEALASISPTAKTAAVRPRMARPAATALACLRVAQTANRPVKATAAKAEVPADFKAKATAVEGEEVTA